MARFSKVERDEEGNPSAWCQRIKGQWRRFPFVASFHFNLTKARARAAEEFEMIFPVLEEKCVLIQVGDSLYDEILNDFVPRWIEKKKAERWMGGTDPNAFVKRGLTGFLGEAAMETFLGVSVLDRDTTGRLAVGDSISFVGADLAHGTGLDIGIKSSERPNFPTPKKNVRRPQVICIRVGERDYYVGGYASVQTQRRCMDSRYVLNDNLRNKRMYNGQLEKSAFWGFHELIPFRSVEDLRNIYYKHR